MTKEIFAKICFLCLMDHHGEGWKNAHPNYIDEKSSMLNAGFGAFGYLDGNNQEKVYEYFEKWNLEFPNLNEQY